GDCYPDTMKGGEKFTKEELLKLGGNDSANHVDFMIGTSDLEITGIRHDGTEVKIFENGNFVI
ncbi:MAG: aminopeptidase, partial [Candidatus Flemingiibacterium sp.]